MKRTKLIASLLTSVMCLSFLVVGVWAAAVNVNFNLNSGLKYYPEGVYVELSGQVYRGSSEESMEALTFDQRFTLEPTTNYDNSTGEPSGNFPIESWEIGAIPFIPTEKFVKIEVTVVNNSEIAIIGTPSILVDENQDISTITNLNVTENKLDVAYIQAGDTAVYELILEVTDSEEINSVLNISFDFSAPEVNYDYFTFSEDGSRITGLSEVYTQDSPQVLYVPGYSEDGQTALSFPGLSSGSISSNTTILIIGEGINSIAQYGFQNCSNLEVIVIPSTITNWGALPFNGCSNLGRIVFSEGLISIGEGNVPYIFGGCSSLKSLVIPASVTTLYGYAFQNMSTSITGIYFLDVYNWYGYSNGSGSSVAISAEELSDPVQALNIVKSYSNLRKIAE
ncbi:MAG TPA: leucine-rich repeat domain-containing protein [Candidatus Caccopulliclostridium gallistercoris]|uniref:Leucine-rich repeat domain-containing protein n=1 Tax=Candidatus Caccopulliclostridium gallistercoris TaxID=2840719 RepID=A0A9D1SY54_9FIRM|nr:leucine-rich repeat domain-containing protein [Candidatus Caccopulliclostridium gallistercoris]